MRFQSTELQEELRNLYRSRATGYLSVTRVDGDKRTYGMLGLIQGELVHAEYALKESTEALAEISELQTPIVSFGNGVVTETPDGTLPTTVQLLGERKPTKTTLGGMTTRQRPSLRSTFGGLRNSAIFGSRGFSTRGFSQGEVEAPGGFGGLNIFTQVLLTMLMVSLIPVAGQWYINNARVRQDLVNLTEANLLGRANALDTQIDAWLNFSVAALDTQTIVAEIRAMEDTVLQAPILARLNNASDQTYMAFTITKEGTSVGNTQKSYRDRSFFQAILAGEPIGAQVFYGRTDTQPIERPKQLTLARPVLDFSGNLAGAIALSISMETVTGYVQEATFGESGYAVLVDPDGTIIAHGRPERLPPDSSSLNLIDPAEPAGTLTQFRQDGVRSVALKQETQLGWTIFAVQDYNDAFATLITAQRFAWLLLVITVSLALLLAFLLARRVVAPIEQLTRVADAISLGELETPVVAQERRDEIGSLARALERLRLTIKIAFQKMRGG